MNIRFFARGRRDAFGDAPVNQPSLDDVMLEWLAACGISAEQVTRNGEQFRVGGTWFSIEMSANVVTINNEWSLWVRLDGSRSESEIIGFITRAITRNSTRAQLAALGYGGAV